MLSNIRPKETEELYATPILQQTAFWSVVKQRLGARTMAINFTANGSDIYGSTAERSTIISDVLIVLQQIDRHHSVAYVPYGRSWSLPMNFREYSSRSCRSHFDLSCRKSASLSVMISAGNPIGQKNVLILMKTVSGKVSPWVRHRNSGLTSTRSTGTSKKHIPISSRQTPSILI